MRQGPDLLDRFLLILFILFETLVDYLFYLLLHVVYMYYWAMYSLI